MPNRPFKRMRRGLQGQPTRSMRVPPIPVSLSDGKISETGLLHKWLAPADGVIKDITLVVRHKEPTLKLELRSISGTENEPEGYAKQFFVKQGLNELHDEMPVKKGTLFALGVPEYNSEVGEVSVLVGFMFYYGEGARSEMPSRRLLEE